MENNFIQTAAWDGHAVACRLIMENNFIQTAGYAVTFTISPIFKHIIDCVQLYVTNGFTNIIL